MATRAPGRDGQRASRCLAAGTDEGASDSPPNARAGSRRRGWCPDLAEDALGQPLVLRGQLLQEPPLDGALAVDQRRRVTDDRPPPGPPAQAAALEHEAPVAEPGGFDSTLGARTEPTHELGQAQRGRPVEPPPGVGATGEDVELDLVVVQVS